MTPRQISAILLAAWLVLFSPAWCCCMVRQAGAKDMPSGRSCCTERQAPARKAAKSCCAEKAGVVAGDQAPVEGEDHHCPCHEQDHPIALAREVSSQAKHTLVPATIALPCGILPAGVENGWGFETDPHVIARAAEHAPHAPPSSLLAQHCLLII